MKKSRVLRLIVFSVLMFIASLALMAALWYINVYGDIGFSAIVFTLTVDNGAVEEGIILGFLLKALLPAVAITAILMTVLNLSPKKDIVINDLKHKKEYTIFPFSRLISSIVSIVLIVSFILSAALLVSFPQYLISMLDKSQLYETEYVDPENVEIIFPEQKRNLIYIMLESMETSFFSKDLGGGLDYNVIPELYNMAADPENINFSHSLDIGGWPVVTNATWTIASIVSQTSGIPLSIPSKRNTYGKTAAFLPGVKSITDILDENGYYQAVMFGSDGNYAGRDQYYLQHGAEVVYDWYSAMDDGIIPEGYKHWWGMEDMKLYEYAKQELPKIAESGQPFCFSMLTVDTHHVGGYKCELCGDQHEEKYENVYSCASKQVASFVEWIKAQPFYENTTIIIVGDHCSMDAAYFDRAFSDEYERHMYNCFINCPVSTTRVKERSFTPMDMFPTTLAAIGCKINGERLGLGTNLFSEKQTLAEKYTIDELNVLLGKNSDYYMDHFVK